MFYHSNQKVTREIGKCGVMLKYKLEANWGLTEDLCKITEFENTLNLFLTPLILPVIHHVALRKSFHSCGQFFLVIMLFI